MAHERSKRRLQRTIKEHREWLEERSEFTAELANEFIGDSFDAGGFDAIKTLPAPLNQLAYVHGVRGIVQLDDGAPSGWDEIYRSAVYHHWAVRLNFGAYFKQAFLGQFGDVVGIDGELTTAANLICYSVVAGIDDMQRSMTDGLVRACTSPGAISEWFWQASIFEPFVLGLISKGFGQGIPEYVQQHDLGVYADIFTHWNDTQKLTDTVVSICDYHCENITDNSKRDRPSEFEIVPFDLIPSEVIAVYKIRKQLGLEEPLVDHPLLSTPFAALGSQAASTLDDELIGRVARLYNQVLA